MSALPDSITDLLRTCARLPGSLDLDQVRRKAGSVNWPVFASAAEAHGLTPLVHHHLAKAATTIPVAVQQQLFGRATMHRMANDVRFAILSEILDAFEAASIRVLVLKGAALAHILYPSPALRPTSDIDLLVAEPEAAAAQAVLGGLGFSAAATPTDRRFVGHHHLPPATLLRNGVFVQVEIHRNAMSADTPVSLTLEESWERRQAFAINGRTASAFGHADMLHHLARHAAERSSLLRLIWVTDIVAYATRFQQDIDWPTLRRNCPFVINALSLLHLITPLPQALLADVPLPSAKVSGAGTAFRPLSEIVQRGRPAGKVLAELFSPGDWWVRFYYGAASRPSWLWYRWVVHPARVTWWFARRAVAWVQWRGLSRRAGP